VKPAVIGLLASFSTAALAQAGRPSTLAMTCAQAKALVASRGAIVLSTSPTTYDRYVRDASFCTWPEMAQTAWVRTADVEQCPLGAVCRSIPNDP